MFYRASTVLMPSSTDTIMRSLTRLTRSVRNVLSSVTICDTFATESPGSAVSSLGIMRTSTGRPFTSTIHRYLFALASRHDRTDSRY